MRGIGQSLTIGERVAWYRRRRGMSQEILAGLVDRTVDWLSKVENGRIDLDRLSVIRRLAEALDVSIGDLVGEPSLLDWSAESGSQTIPTLRTALLDYRQLSPFAIDPQAEPPSLNVLHQSVWSVWDAYQTSRYGFVTRRLPELVREVQTAASTYDGDEQRQALALLGLTYQAATVLLTKLGETDLAWISAERGFQAAQRAGDTVIIGSLFRSVAHALLSTGRYSEATQLVRSGADFLQPHIGDASPDYLSVYGTLLLVGSLAAARDEDRQGSQEFLREADETALRLGADANYLWTAFGPTNVAIHRVASAMDLGDVQVAIDLGPRIDTSHMPVERRVRHAMETARALSAWNRTDEALATLLGAERLAPEQVRHHALSRRLVQSWVRRGRTRPSFELAALAQRVHVAS
jgi:transcriptional regulator with XRE-family HTH domain